MNANQQLLSRNARRRANRRARAQQTLNIRPAAAGPRRQQQQQQPRQPRAQARRPRRNNQNGGGLLSAVGGAVGSIFGPTGTAIGSALGSGIGRIIGSGDYILSSPVGTNSLAGTTPPMFGSATGATRIRHREFIGDIFSSTGFTVRSYPLAPGISTLFPWLSHMAANYEQYRFRGLVVEFKSTSASALNSTNTALGVVGIATQYDAAEPDFQSKQEAENYIGAQSCNPGQSLLHFVECAPGQNPMNMLYTRTGILPSNQDIKFYDMGKVQLFTQGMQAGNVNIGELWVSYDIEFLKPKVPSGGDNQAAPMDWYNNTAVGYQNIYLSGKVANAIDYPSYGNLGTQIINNTVVFPSQLPRGRYIVCIWAHPIIGNGAATTISTGVPTFTNASAANVLQQATGDYGFVRYSAAGAQVPYFVCALDIIQSGQAVVQLTGFDLSGTNNSQFNLTVYVAAIKNNDIQPQTTQVGLLTQALFEYGIDLNVLRKMTRALHDQEREVLDEHRVDREEPSLIRREAEEISYDRM